MQSETAFDRLTNQSTSKTPPTLPLPESKQSNSDWLDSFRKWVNRPRPAAPSLNDDALRRENLYE
jgi:hypothetical protein